jgi:DNA-binding FrmR family transcriptional regulator
MSETLLIIVSVVEIVALVVVLAVYLLIVAGQLRSIVSTLQEVNWGARAVERQLLAVQPNVSKINLVLAETASSASAAADAAESLIRNRRGVMS